MMTDSTELSTAFDIAAREKENMPPMLSQYLDYKNSYPDSIVFFQVGDFYEVFFQDAITVAQKLNLTLTSRDKNNPNPVPMCGVPVAAIDSYLDRLVAQGFSAAVVSQLNSPMEMTRGDASAAAKITVQRKLMRIVTPGVRILSNAEQGVQQALVAAVAVDSEHEAALAYSDVQSGVVQVREGLSVAALYRELRKIAPNEVLVPSVAGDRKVDRRTPWVKRLEQIMGTGQLRFRAPGLFDALGGQSKISRNFSAITGYASLTAAARRAVRLLVDFVDETTVDGRVKIAEVRRAGDQGVLLIDATTRDNLELVKNCRDGGSQGTLLALLNRTVTVVGERLLRQWLLAPLTDLVRIQQRAESVSSLKGAARERARIRVLLQGLTDLERIAARLELGMATPRELAALRDVLAVLPEIEQGAAELAGRQRESGKIDELLADVSRRLQRPEALHSLLQRSLADSVPLSSQDGGVIRQGFDAELDQLRQLRSKGRTWIQELESKERSATGIGSLKIKYNYVLGYFIEVTRANVGRVPEHYQRRQSTANTERYTTEALRVQEAELAGAEDKERELERKLFEAVRSQVAEFSSDVRRLSAAIAELDVLACLAEVADGEDYVRPQIDVTSDLIIHQGRHPVLAKLLEGRFVPNSLHMSQGGHSCFVVTGPNMGGKSTFLRQAGLIVILAQMGSFVPAVEARIGIVDQIYARIGASDNITEGESTFMVEMRETAHILSGASARSLLLVDEIGRGTATSDGLAIAQAILEWIVSRITCRTIFATHFHELTQLAGGHPGLANLSVGSIEQGDDVIFTHEICQGPASKSYGIEVAKLACLPMPVLERARQILLDLSQHEQPGAVKNEARTRPRQGANQLALFGAFSAPEVRELVRIPADYAQLQDLRQRLCAVDLNATTPLQALTLLFELCHDLEK